MWNRIKRIFALPVFEDEQKTRTAGVQHVILLVMAVGPMLGFLSLDMGGADKSAELVNDGRRTFADLFQFKFGVHCISFRNVYCPSIASRPA